MSCGSAPSNYDRQNDTRTGANSPSADYAGDDSSEDSTRDGWQADLNIVNITTAQCADMSRQLKSKAR
jgi:hypothetical protein